MGMMQNTNIYHSAVCSAVDGTCQMRVLFDCMQHTELILQDHRSPLNARRWYLSGLLLPARENRRLQKFYRYDVRMWFESRLVMCIEAALIHAQSQIQFAIIIISMSRVLFCELFSSTKLYFCREMRQFRWRCRPILNSTCRPQKLDAK